MLEYDNREFEDIERPFSSFTYLIDSYRITSAVMPLVLAAEAKAASDSDVDRADTRIDNWLLHLPKCKQEIIKDDGQTDETLFLAHLMINTLVSLTCMLP